MTKEISLPARWTMWESFSSAIEGLAQHDREAAKDLLYAMWEYASFGREPDFGDDYMRQFAFDSLRFNLDASVKSCASGKRGGKKKAANAKKNDDQQEKEDREESAISRDELKSAKKVTRAMGKLYQTVVDDAVPDEVLEEQASWLQDMEEMLAREAMLG